MPSAHFSRDLFRFLTDLRKNNNREWFTANKERFEHDVREPILRFISDVGPKLEAINPHFVADPRPNGGSLFRIHRDTRFSKDKSPYKTHLGAQFFHEAAKKSPSVPGFYLHFSPGESFVAAGIWHPDPKALGQMRDAIAAGSPEWKELKKSRLTIEGDSLKRPPRGYDPEHPDIESLKRTDFVTSVPLTDAEMCDPKFLGHFVKSCKSIAPILKFTTRSLGLAW